MAGDVHARDERVEVARGDVVGVVVVDEAAGPGDGALPLAGDAGGPDAVERWCEERDMVMVEAVVAYLS